MAYTFEQAYHALNDDYLKTGIERFSVSDPRANKCYEWEVRYSQITHASKNSANDLPRGVAKGVARLCAKVALRRLTAKYGLSPESQEKIRSSFKARFCDSQPLPGALAAGCRAGVIFARGGWSPGIIAHEVAHWADDWEMVITNEFRKRTAHGPKWLGWYVFLLIDVIKVDETALRDSLRQVRLRFTMP